MPEQSLPTTCPVCQAALEVREDGTYTARTPLHAGTNTLDEEARGVSLDPDRTRALECSEGCFEYGPVVVRDGRVYAEPHASGYTHRGAR